MDTTDPEEIILIIKCNHCHRYEEELPKEFSGEVANQKLTQIINEIKERKEERMIVSLG
jgi:hypothetical protein